MMCCSANGIWDDKDCEDTLSGMAQILHLASTGQSVAGTSAQERRQWHAQVGCVDGDVCAGCSIGAGQYCMTAC